MKFKALVDRIGHRGAFLLSLSALDFIYGYMLFLTPRPHFHGTFIHPFYPTWAIIWMIMGVVLLIGAFAKRDRLHFGLAATVKAAWAAEWLLVWIYNPGAHLAWSSVAIWTVVATLVVTVSTWPEVRRVGRKPETTKDLE